MEPSNASPSHPTIPIAIVVGFAMIAIAIFFTGGKSDKTPNVQNNNDEARTLSSTPRAVDGSDFIRGNPNAPILIVEYSDYDCPFCKQYHTTLKQIMDEYGITGRVAWVYRQYPIGQLHPNSPNVSEAALCVGSLGGSEAFWKFTDMIFENREIDEPTNPIKLPEYAVEAGVSQDEYFACIDSNKTEDALKTSVEDAFNIGARGTPYTVITVGNEQAVVNGAQSYEVVKGIIDNLLRQLDGTFDPKQSTATTTQ